MGCRPCARVAGRPTRPSSNCSRHPAGPRGALRPGTAPGRGCGPARHAGPGGLAAGDLQLEATEPVRPLVIEDAVDPDLVTGRLGLVAGHAQAPPASRMVVAGRFLGGSGWASAMALSTPVSGLCSCGHRNARDQPGRRASLQGAGGGGIFAGRTARTRWPAGQTGVPVKIPPGTALSGDAQPATAFVACQVLTNARRLEGRMAAIRLGQLPPIAPAGPLARRAVDGLLPCQRDPQLWFSDLPDELELAKAHCRPCPLRG